MISGGVGIMTRFVYCLLAFVTLALCNAVAFADDVVITIRTFIPAEHPSKPDWMIQVPNSPGKTMMPDLGVGQCFGTDSRTFSNKRIESARFGGTVVISPTAVEPVSAVIITGITHEYDCATGQIVCEKTSGEGSFSISDVVSSNGVHAFSYKGEASNPCLLVAPDIEFNGRVVVDTNSKTVSIDANNDVFPSFEAFVWSDGKVNTLYRVDPKDGATPLSLGLSGADRNVKKEVKY
jgi:hypothetical protein